MNNPATDFSSVSGADTSNGMIDQAQKRISGRTNFQVSQGDHLPFPDNQFNVAYSMSLFHHMAIASRLTVLSEMTPVVRNGGWIINFEHNLSNSVARWIVKRYALDRQAALLYAGELSSLCGVLWADDSMFPDAKCFPPNPRAFLASDFLAGSTCTGAQ